MGLQFGGATESPTPAWGHGGPQIRDVLSFQGCDEGAPQAARPTEDCRLQLPLQDMVHANGLLLQAPVGSGRGHQALPV